MTDSAACASRWTCPAKQHIDVEAIASEVSGQLEDMDGSKRVSTRINPGLPMLLVEPARLELVLLILVSNAVKYSDPQTRIVLEIEPVGR